MKAATKVTRDENGGEDAIKKTATANKIAAKKEKELTVRIESEVEKTRLRMIFDIELIKRIKRVTKDFKSETIELR